MDRLRTLTVRHARAAVRRRPGPIDAGTAAMLATVVLWGPADVAVTLVGWQFESNPLVLALGPAGWVASKVVVLAVAVWVWSASRDWYAKTALADVWMVLLALVGAVTVGLNLAVLAGASG